MKLMTNFFQAKKPSLEEGPMIYTVSDEYSANTRTERSKAGKHCVRFMRCYLHVLLLLLILFVIWAAFMFAGRVLGWREEPARCGVLYDWVGDDSPNKFNPAEVDDMIENGSGTVKAINYTDDYMEMTTSASLNEDMTTYDNFDSWDDSI